MNIENRKTQRVNLSKLAFAKEGEKAHGGLLRDVSESGAFIEFYYPMGRVEHNFNEGDNIELLLDGDITVTGTAVRIEREGIALKFDTTAAEQSAALEALIEAEIAEAAAEEAG